MAAVNPFSIGRFLHSFAKVKKALEPFTSFYWDELTLRRASMLVRESIPRIDGPAVFETLRLRITLGDRPDSNWVRSTAIAIAGNVPALRAAHPVGRWAGTTISIPTVLLFTRCDRAKGRHAEAVYRFTFTALFGPPAGQEGVCAWSFRRARLIALVHGGCSRKAEKWPFEHPSQMVGCYFKATVGKSVLRHAFEGDVRPRLDEVLTDKTLLTRNGKLNKMRFRRNQPCLLDLDSDGVAFDCHRKFGQNPCPAGYARGEHLVCPLSTHADAFAVIDCPGCGREAVFADDEVEGDLCISCWNKVRLRTEWYKGVADEG
jgi:hypothetical protein